MIIASRVQARLTELGITQSELGRRVGVTAGTINALVRGKSRASTHLPRLARALNTTPAYLEGEIDDPSGSMAPDPDAPVMQYLALPVALPAEDALAHAFKRVLALSRGVSEDELAEILAKRLPTVLKIAADGLDTRPVERDAR